MKQWLWVLFLGCAMSASDVLPVSQNDLVTRYGEYSGKRVIVTGKVVSDAEMTLMYLSGAGGGPTAGEGMLNLGGNGQKA
jgi:hypothetical protein